MVSLERHTQATGFTVACSDNTADTFLPLSSYRTKAHRYPCSQLLVDTAQKPHRHSTKTTIAVGRSWHPFKEHLWRRPAMTGTGSLRGGLTTRAEHRKDTVFPALCPCCGHMTSLGQAAPPSSNSSQRNIPATHNQNYQAPSPTQQPAPPLKWKPKPRAFSLCEEGADKQEPALVSWKEGQE